MSDSIKRHFLIFLPLPEEHQHLHERLMATAKTFFETVAPAERREFGVFQRSTKPNRPPEILPLVVVTCQPDEVPERDLARARALETVIRATLGAAGITADARVFVDYVPAQSGKTVQCTV